MLQMRTSAQVLAVNTTAEGNDLNQTAAELAKRVDDIVNDADLDPLQRGLRIAKELAQKLDGLRKAQAPSMLGFSAHQFGSPSHVVSGEEFAHERSLIMHTLKRSDLDPLSKSSDLATEFSKLLGVCEGGSPDALQSSSRGSPFWAPRMCSITCSGALGAVGPSCVDLGSACLPTLLNAVHACASCPDQLCTSVWTRSAVQAGCQGKWSSAGDFQPLCNVCKPWQPHYDANMLSLESNLAAEPDHIVSDGSWVAEKDLFERIYQNTAMDPISRTLYLEDEVAKMVSVCDAGAKHTTSTSLIEVEFWGWFKKAGCSIGCLAAVAGGAVACVASAGVACPIALAGCLGTCSSCPGTFCLAPALQGTLSVLCRPPFAATMKPVCDFCRDYRWFY